MLYHRRGYGGSAPHRGGLTFEEEAADALNVLRHAGARRIDVHVAWSANRVSLSIRDDGRGFDPVTLDDAATRGHLGVPGMRERIRARGGQLRLISTPGEGTTVDVELDVPPAAANA